MRERARKKNLPGIDEIGCHTSPLNSSDIFWIRGLTPKIGETLGTETDQPSIGICDAFDDFFAALLATDDLVPPQTPDGTSDLLINRIVQWILASSWRTQSTVSKDVALTGFAGDALCAQTSSHLQ